MTSASRPKISRQTGLPVSTCDISCFMVCFIVLCLLIACGLVSGCQSVNVVEYYEPTSQNVQFSVPGTDGKPGLGPVKRIESKNGIRDWSQNMNIKTNVSVFGL